MPRPRVAVCRRPSSPGPPPPPLTHTLRPKRALSDEHSASMCAGRQARTRKGSEKRPAVRHRHTLACTRICPCTVSCTRLHTRAHARARAKDVFPSFELCFRQTLAKVTRAAPRFALASAVTDVTLCGESAADCRCLADALCRVPVV